MDGGRMDEFPVLGQVQYSRADIPIYWNYAAQYGLGDAFFSSAATASQPNHLMMIAGQTGGEFFNGGDCTSPPYQLMLSRSKQGNEYWGYPCYNITSLPSMLGQYGISWRYYGSVPIWDAPLNVASL